MFAICRIRETFQQKINVVITRSSDIHQGHDEVSFHLKQRQTRGLDDIILNTNICIYLNNELINTNNLCTQQNRFSYTRNFSWA